MIDKDLLAALAADHRKNRLTHEEARAFLKDLMEVCDKHRVFLRTTDQLVQFSKIFADSQQRTKLIAQLGRDGACVRAKIDYR